MSIFLEELLSLIPSDTEERVERTKERLNQIIREALRRETGIGLAQKDTDTGRIKETVGVPITLVSGFPDSIKYRELSEKEQFAALLTPWRQTLETLRNSSTKVKEILLPVICNSKYGSSLLKNKEHLLRDVSDLAEELLRMIQDFDLVKWILEVNQDILGIYKYRVSQGSPLFFKPKTVAKIEIYWGAIGLVSQSIGVTIEDLTTVVLAHELAHAYTHLGCDIDGHRWDTSDFTKSDHELKEGLAQYYTFLVCKRIARHMPYSEKAYEELLKRQPAAYQTHAPWTKLTPEVIRLGMLEIRRTGIGQSKDFNKSLEEACNTLRVRPDKK